MVTVARYNDPPLFVGPNGALCCAEHKGSEGWGRRKLKPQSVLLLRMELLQRGLVALHEPLCETCRGIFRRPEAARLLTGGDA